MHDEVETDGHQPLSWVISSTRNTIRPALVQLNMGRKFWKALATVVDGAQGRERKQKNKTFLLKDVPTPAAEV